MTDLPHFADLRDGGNLKSTDLDGPIRFLSVCIAILLGCAVIGLAVIAPSMAAKAHHESQLPYGEMRGAKPASD